MGTGLNPWVRLGALRLRTGGTGIGLPTDDGVVEDRNLLGPASILLDIGGAPGEIGADSGGDTGEAS